MLAIKFQRVGKKHQPSYRIVVAEKRSKLGGPPVEQVGFYNPATKEASLEKERVLHWLKTGAKPTVSVHNLFVKNGVVSEPKIAIKTRKPEVAPEATAATKAPEAGAAAQEEVVVAKTATDVSQPEIAVEPPVEAAAQIAPAADTASPDQPAA